jgi:hypothetical protein
MKTYTLCSVDIRSHDLYVSKRPLENESKYLTRGASAAQWKSDDKINEKQKIPDSQPNPLFLKKHVLKVNFYCNRVIFLKNIILVKNTIFWKRTIFGEEQNFWR